MLKILAVHALLTLGAPLPATDTVLVVRPGTRLDLDLGAQRANVEISVWERDEVSIESPLRLSVRGAGQVVQVEPNGRDLGRRTTYEIRVPAWMPLEVKGTMADVTATGAGAEISLETTMGELTITGGEGRVTARSLQGAVTLTDVSGLIEAYSGNGGIRITRASGSVQAETLNGSIRLTDIESSEVLATSTNGNLDFTGPIHPDGRYRFSTHNGRVRVTVQEDADATVTVSTYNGSYNASFPVLVTSMERERRFTFVVGDGTARIEASSFNGDIEFRRPGEGGGDRP